MSGQIKVGAKQFASVEGREKKRGENNFVNNSSLYDVLNRYSKHLLHLKGML